MKTTNGKAAGVLDTPQAALINKRIPILASFEPPCKEYDTARAGLALKGFELRRGRYKDRAPLFYVKHHESGRVYSSWHDVIAFLASLGGSV